VSNHLCSFARCQQQPDPYKSDKQGHNQMLLVALKNPTASGKTKVSLDRYSTFHWAVSSSSMLMVMMLVAKLAHLPNHHQPGVVVGMLRGWKENSQRKSTPRSAGSSVFLVLFIIGCCCC
jgi:hypothetical protein